MKSTIVLLGFLLSFTRIGAQENNVVLSNVEQFCKTQGRTITGYLVYKDHYGMGSGVNAIAMKYIDNQTKDSINGVTFSCNMDKGSFSASLYRSFDAMIDYDEFFKIISWLESCLPITKDPATKIGFLSYSPKKGNFQLKLQRHVRSGSSYSSDSWDFIVRFNRYDADSEIDLFTSIDDAIGKLKAFKEKL